MESTGATYLFTIFIRDDRAFGSPCICAENDSVLKKASYDSCTGTGGLGQWYSLLAQEVVSIQDLSAISIEYDKTLHLI